MMGLDYPRIDKRPIYIKYRCGVRISSILYHIITEASIGGVNGGESGKFYAVDGDVILLIYGTSTEYSRLGRV